MDLSACISLDDFQRQGIFLGAYMRMCALLLLLSPSLAQLRAVVDLTEPFQLNSSTHSGPLNNQMKTITSTYWLAFSLLRFLGSMRRRFLGFNGVHRVAPVKKPTVVRILRIRVTPTSSIPPHPSFALNIRHHQQSSSLERLCTSMSPREPTMNKVRNRAQEKRMQHTIQFACSHAASGRRVARMYNQTLFCIRRCGRVHHLSFDAWGPYVGHVGLKQRDISWCIL